MTYNGLTSADRRHQNSSFPHPRIFHRQTKLHFLPAATSPEAKVLMLGWIVLYTQTQRDIICTHNTQLSHSAQQVNVLSTFPKDSAWWWLFHSFSSLTLKALCSSYLLSAVTILYLCHCLAFPFPFLTHLLPTGYRRLTFPKLSVDTFLRDRRSKKLPPKQHWQQTETWDLSAGNCLNLWESPSVCNYKLSSETLP